MPSDDDEDARMTAHGVRVPDPLWELFVAKCARVGLKAPEIIRHLILTWVEKDD